MSTKELNTQQLLSDLKRVVADSEELLRATKDAAGDQAEQARERIVAAMESAKRTYHRLEEKAVEGAKAADQTIRDHPYQSIGIAFGIGLLIGVLVTKK